jgi:hypothetical protein
MHGSGDERITTFRALLIACVAAGLSLGAAAPGALAFTASVEATPSTIVYYGPGDRRTTRTIDYQVRITAGPEAESVVMDDDLGSATAAGGPATLTNVSESVTHGDPGPVRGPGACRFGALFIARARYQLMLPAGSISTITFRQYLRLTSAPLHGNEIGASFRLASTPPTGPGRVGDPLPGAVTVSSAPPRLLGLMPSQLDLRAGPTGSGPAIGGPRALVVRVGTAMRISGTLRPGRRGDLVTIWDYAPGATKPRRLAKVAVDGHGRFQYLRWRPKTTGRWDLYATWPGRDGVVEPARSACGGPQFTVARSLERTSAARRALVTGRATARGDVNGDGRADQIRFRGQNFGVGQLTIRLAGGATLAIGTGQITTTDAGIVRVANLDGRKGDEVVVRTQHISTCDTFEVFTYRSG